MQIWVKATNDSQLIYKALSIGLTTNIVGPFLSSDNDLSVDKILSKHSNAKIWDSTISNLEKFNSLEVMAAKHAYDHKMGFIIEVRSSQIDFEYIHTANTITQGNLIVEVKNTHGINDFNFLSLLNLDLNCIIMGQVFESMQHLIKYRNYYMKKTRLGQDFTGESPLYSDIEQLLRDNMPDFILVDLETYINRI